MSTTTETPKVEVNLSPELQKRYNEAKDDTARLAVLHDYAKEQGAEAAKRGMASHFSEDQMKTIMTKMGEMSSESARAAVAAVTEDIQKNFGIERNEANEIARRSAESVELKQRNQREDMEVAAQVFRGMFLARQGRPDAYSRASEAEAAHYKKRYNRDIRAMSLGTDTTGGYLAPTLFSDMLYENISRTSLVRRFATMIPMRGNEIINIPTMTAGISAAAVSEATAASGVQPTFSQKQLTTKKLVTKTRPISTEMIEKANPAIVTLLLQHASVEIMKAEDSLVFGTSGNGIRNTSTNLVTTGSAAGGYASFDFDDFISMESELTAEYLAGEDIQGSGIITGAPRYFLPHALVQEMKKKKETGTGAYLDETRELRNQKQIFGYGVSRVLSLPDGSSLSAADKVGIFGNLAHVWCGVEPGFRVLIADQGVTDNGGSDVNLFDTAQVAIRVLEFFDSVVVDPEALSIASMAA